MTHELLQILIAQGCLGCLCITAISNDSFTATNSMKPPAFDIGYGVYRSFYFTEYVPPPSVKTSQTSKDLSQMDDEEPSNNNYNNTNLLGILAYLLGK